MILKRLLGCFLLFLDICHFLVCILVEYCQGATALPSQAYSSALFVSPSFLVIIIIIGFIILIMKLSIHYYLFFEVSNFFYPVPRLVLIFLVLGWS